jgi:hypothetical protein
MAACGSRAQKQMGHPKGTFREMRSAVERDLPAIGV